ncbi:MAG: DNA polymerase III subunit gamma/tau, partial [Candidatus Eremiobacteraeota bacterium]|nr:DNA polymerase III subunit gamma/tau [Candidatus Eremiobacteraeota bacterium]
GNNLDVFEIDAASHTQVDKIRDFIVEKVRFTPVAARYKVYIIDEVHKLSTSSFNALLKTLEEPPSHVVFVLATTHPHEMPSTILSRCQRYDFRPLTAGEAEKHLLMIAGEEGINLEIDAARQLARAADGSLRDALVLFEQANVYAEGQVTRDSVLDLLGGVGYEVMEEMFNDLVSGDAASALQRLDGWIVRGRDLKRLAESFQDHLRMMLLLKVRSEDQSIRHLSTEERDSLDRIVAKVSVKAVTQWLRAVGEMLTQIRHGRHARLEWEMLLVELACPQTDPTMDGLEKRLERIETSGGGSGASPVDLIARLEKLERGGAGGADDSRIAEMERQIARLSESTPVQSAVDDSRVAELERQIARLSHTLSELSEARPSAPPEPPPEPKVKPAIVPTEKAEVATVANLPVEVELESDVVDQWLEMPDVLVTGRVSRSGQGHLLDELDEELAEALPEPVAEVSPEPPASERATVALSEESVEFEEPPEEDYGEEEDYEPEKWERESSTEVQPAVEPAKEEPEASVQPERVEAPRQVETPEPGPAPDPVEQTSSGISAEAKKMLAEPKEFFRLLMQGVKERDIRLHAVLADARLTKLEQGSFELAVPEGYDWHFGKIQEGRALLESVAESLLPGATPKLQCGLGGEKAAPPKENEHEELVKRASGVFGGSSVVD